MTKFNDHFWDKLRKIVREEVDASVEYKTAGIRTDIADLKSDMNIVKEVQGSHGLLLRTMNASLTSLKNNVRAQSKEINRFGILLEDLEYRFEAGSEMA